MTFESLHWYLLAEYYAHHKEPLSNCREQMEKYNFRCTFTVYAHLIGGNRKRQLSNSSSFFNI
jgi:hypothetical protein